MKIAIIDHIGNPGGGSRVVRALLPAMKKMRKDLDLTFFGNPHSIRREDLKKIAEPHGIEVRELKSAALAGKDLFKIRGSRHVISLFQRKFSPWLAPVSHYLSGAVDLELEKVIRGFDIAFFTWPFHLKCPRLSCPMAGIFHDFNFKYFFSGQTMAPWVLEFMNRQMPIWLERSTPIVSTEFMKTELAKFYPTFGNKTKVVPVAPTSIVSTIGPQEAKKLVEKRFQLDRPFILCPTNIGSHKNIGSLLAAFSLLQSKWPQMLLVFAGSGTEIIRGSACSIGLEIDQNPPNVMGLGYVMNEEIDALIQSAAVVVNPSLYEGGNVPGFDAWARGVPVAMSHIPTFLEHMAVHDVRAQLFDPRSPADIADKLDQILSHPDQAMADALHSSQAIAAFTWERAAQGYLNIFEEMLSYVLT